jgi:uracil-DNA glycosylase
MNESKTMIVGFRRNSNDEGPAFEGSASGRTLDKIIPNWRSCVSYNLYKTKTDESDPLPGFNEKIISAQPDLVVMLGREVEKILTGKRNHPMLEPFEFKDGKAVVLPHPSPVNRVWNDKSMFDKTRTAMEGME